MMALGRNQKMAMALGVFVAGMVGVAFASVPIYQLFCQVTGYGGTPKIGAEVVPVKVSERTITVRFDANTNHDMPWKFTPVVTKMVVRLGEPNMAYYRARNKSDEKITGTAVFNVTPFKAGPYFSKIDCFCFTEQVLKAGASAELPVQFFVDPAILDDPNTKTLKEITLSYTFFRAEPDKEKDSETREGKKSVSNGGNDAETNNWANNWQARRQKLNKG